MDDALVVGILNRLGNLADDFSRFLSRQRSLHNTCRETLPLDKPHREIMLSCMLPNLIDWHDPGMFKLSGSFGFGIKPLHVGVRRKLPTEYHLYRHDAVKLQLPGFIDDAHAAARDFF